MEAPTALLQMRGADTEGWVRVKDQAQLPAAAGTRQQAWGNLSNLHIQHLFSNLFPRGLGPLQQ